MNVGQVIWVSLKEFKQCHNVIGVGCGRHDYLGWSILWHAHAFGVNDCAGNLAVFGQWWWWCPGPLISVLPCFWCGLCNSVNSALFTGNYGGCYLSPAELKTLLHVMEEVG